MSDRRRFKLILFVSLLALLLLCCCFFLLWEQQMSWDVTLISPEMLDEMNPALLIDLSLLQYKGEKAPMDTYTETLYLPCDLSSARPFKGLSCLDPSCRLYIVADPVTEDLAKSMAASGSLRLAICRGNNYQLINLVLTSFPVIALDTASSFIDERGYPAYRGQFTFSMPAEEQSISSKAQWNVRGDISARKEKKPWKLELQKLSGKDMEMELMGLGTDSDWILNPMVFDDLKLRENFAMDCWNKLLRPDYVQWPMSRGEYVEIIFDGQYFGLYMLQKRIDQVFLGLDADNSIIFKHGSVPTEKSLTVNYELVWSPYDYSTSYSLLQQALDDPESRNLDSLLSMNLFLDFLSARDNKDYKNMYYILQKQDNGGFLISYLPWDTDLTLGMIASSKVGITLDYETALNDSIIHHELADMSQFYPQLELELAKLWQTQRQTVYSEEQLFLILDALCEQLNASGALIRDMSVWEESNGWYESQDMLYSHIAARLLTLDQYYAAFID